MSKKIIISGTGCALADNLYTNINFDGDTFKKYLSKSNADGGLSPGKLVFKEEFEKFAGKPFEELLKEITENRTADTFNIGGPSLVTLINAAQLLSDEEAQINFYGAIGKDKIGEQILSDIASININTAHYKRYAGQSPFTDVFSDPNYDNGRGERIFINNIGAAWNYLLEDLDDAFFESDITIFGGTALVPNIHDNLTIILKKAKNNNCVTIVNTVYDFRNEKLNPSKKWPLVENDRYELIDLLIMDKEEALKISGQKNIDEAINFFKANNAHGLIITQGPDPVLFYSSGNFFSISSISKLHISEAVSIELQSGKIKGDTTGCGDNFVGGVLAAITKQLMKGSKKLDLTEAVKWGIVSGGIACFYYGGVFKEARKGQKFNIHLEYLRQYYDQLN